MSSEGSVMSGGSRLRELGLYRTIDARTEEFLRLSKRRQLRQGCACAALSAAVTVTLVVTVLLVYEYSLHPQRNNSKNFMLNPKWLGFNNNAAESLDDPLPTTFVSDKATVKLLPLLLKALTNNSIKTSNNNSNINEDDMNGHYDGTMTPREYLEKTQGKLLYTAKPKTLPVSYYRHPMKTTEYYTKYKKIRDYQRIFNYFHKMISDRANFDTLSLVKRDFQKFKTPLRDHKRQDIKRNSDEHGYRDTLKTSDCLCLEKIDLLLRKLIIGLNQVVPHLKAITQSCNSQETKNKLRPKGQLIESLRLISQATNTNKTNKVPSLPATNISWPNEIKDKNNINQQQLSGDNRIHNDPQTSIATPVLKVTKKQSTHHKQNHPRVTTPGRTGAATPSTHETATSEMFMHSDKKAYKPKSSAVRKVLNESYQKDSKLSTEEYEEYFNPTRAVTNLDFVDDTLSLMKNKLTYDENHKMHVKKTEIINEGIQKAPTYPGRNKNDPIAENKNITSSTRKSILYSHHTTENINNVTVKESFNSEHNDPKFQVISTTYQIANSNQSNETKFYNIKTFIKNSTLAAADGRGDFYTVEEILSWDNVVVDEENFIGRDEFQENDFFKLILNTNNITAPKVLVDNDRANATLLNLSTTYSSMIPHDKPAYLEIQREWKRDEQTDFDVDNVNNNVYDFLNS
ncbi:uncharacterized protein LOC114245612 isoform X2 [Bombyx mandarina]|uniref:Uncharacterized protein LOC114245612 isoform X2 n=1 Tax=Bombyx mandarina TaxID=7092 RepID=A0A6J2JUY0_BOMMA|nr:uncharacterized protein LOC114245612 isoform X2 [Bombyx mandarina]